MKILGISIGRSAKTSATSDFSRFFREASSGEKKKVYMEVARKASEDQRKLMARA